MTTPKDGESAKDQTAEDIIEHASEQLLISSFTDDQLIDLCNAFRVIVEGLKARADQ